MSSHHYQNYSMPNGVPSKQYTHNNQHHPVKHHAHHSYHHNNNRMTVDHRNDHEVRGSHSYESTRTGHASLGKDDHSIATATTAAFTSHAGSHSYSMDDGSVASEYGTEIVMNRTPGSIHGGAYGRFKNSTPYSAHTFKAGNHTFTVDTKYSFNRVIGSGAYGVVISAHDTQLNTKVAIKMVPKAFQDEIDAKRILREIKLLKHLKHENIVGIVDMMPPMYRYVDDFNDVYIVSELMETDLYRIIYSKQSLSIDHVQYFIYQVLRALKYIHSANVLHRDLKPSNLLVNSNCDLKVCDFGLARGVYGEEEMNEGKKPLLTEYVVTRWYRAPEIMLACHEYDKPVDVWSTGCILAELLARKPYFPGEDYIDQLTLITGKLGKLPEEELDFVTSEKARRFMRKLPNKPVVPLSQQFPETPPEALDLLGKMLQIHPKKRITVDEALKHPFMAQLHSEEDEPMAERPFDFSFEDEKLHRIRLQELIWEEVGDFRPMCLPVPPRRDGSRPPIRRPQRLHYI
ncbi:predicted protein [Thalassiosira pseudonana CCMP1335]|uniref:Mitogen-activated protein kinase n=1 Tax=Thalassiosira pseudonana TaxID=35128 RepID=B8C1Q8_THAPS|nr:predicted protein [Thalassiosira pseudonana CCMP1335]EED91806.1 predicted protein [Thalassiosira pseudonana CCMP1335]